MKILKNILFATDFSKSSEYVQDNIMRMAKIFQSEITLIYVLPDDITNKKAKDLLNDYASKELHSIMEKLNRAGVSTSDPILDCGDFSKKIVQEADRINANMIMIGAGEELENDVFMLGAKAKKIIKESNKPVFVVKNQKQFDVKRILCPVDFSDESGRALQNAISLAHSFDAELLILTAFQVPPMYYRYFEKNIEEDIMTLRGSTEGVFAAFLDNFELAGLKVITEIKQGEADIAILKAAKKHNSDLLIIATTGKSGLRKILLGSVADTVIQNVSCSFITIKNEDVLS